MSEKVKLIRRQASMNRMLYALTPLVLAGIGLYGWRVAAMLVVATAFGFAAEYVFLRPYREPVSTALFVTTVLYVLSLPPTLPLWMTAVGAVFGVVFGKMVFGGFGKNVFNPALTGRAFVYISFGNHMTASWSEPVGGFFGGFSAWAAKADAITTATPGVLLKQGEAFDLGSLFWGDTAGVIGGTGAALTVLCGLYIVWKKAADYRLVISCLLGYLIAQSTLWLMEAPGGIDPLRGMLAGAFLIGTFFYATEPVTACKTHIGRWIYGALIGVLSSLIAALSSWPAGTMFAILLANTFAGIIDYAIVQAGGDKKPKGKKAIAAKSGRMYPKWRELPAPDSGKHENTGAGCSRHIPNPTGFCGNRKKA